MPSPITNQQLKEVYILWLALAVAPNDLKLLQNGDPAMIALVKSRLPTLAPRLTALLDPVNVLDEGTVASLTTIQSSFKNFLQAEAPYQGPPASCYSLSTVLNLLAPAAPAAPVA